MKPDIQISIGTEAIDFHYWVYPAGEIGVRVQGQFGGSYALATITAKLKCANDIMALLLIVDALKRQNPYLILEQLIVPYFPYARQDRVATIGDPHSLKVMVGLIENLGFRRIEVTDPHSSAIENCFQKTHMEIAKHSTSRLKDVISQIVHKDGEFASVDHSDVILVIPDEGAAKRIRIWAGLTNSETVSFIKQRDPQTGALSGFKMIDGNPLGKKCLIVDDICDGGGTFLGIAQQLKKHGASELYLYVTHGIFSAGYEKLCESFTKIFTTESFQERSLYDSRITVL